MDHYNPILTIINHHYNHWMYGHPILKQTPMVGRSILEALAVGEYVIDKDL